MRASLIIIRSEISGERDIIELRRRRVIRTLAPKTHLPFICVLNGAPLLRSEWGRCVKDGDILGFVIRPLDGGGGGSNPVQLVAMVALMYFTMGAGAALWMPAGMAGTFGGALLGTAAFAAGSSIINSVVGPMGLPSPLQMQALAAPSPTYNLAAQGNSARLGQAIPEIFGRHIVFPDLGAAPYTEFAGNEQFLYQLFVVGRGEYALEAVKIEDTLINSFGEVDYEVVPPGSQVTLFPSNVATSLEVAGQEVAGKSSGTYVQSGTTITVTQVAHGLLAGTKTGLDFTSGTAVDGDFTIDTVPTADTFTVTAAGSLSTSGAVLIYLPIGPFTLNPAGTTTRKISVDVVAPRGIFYANDSGGLDALAITFRMDYRLIDDAGAPLGAWTTPLPNQIAAGGAVIAALFTGNGAQTAFTLESVSVASSTIEVRVDGVLKTTGWSFSNNTGDGGKDQVVFSVAPRTPALVRITADSDDYWDTMPNIKIAFRENISETEEVLFAATTTPQRYSASYAVASGRYEIRLRRTDTANTSSRAGHALQWAAARAYLPDPTTYGNCTLLAMRIRATNNLSQQASRKVNLLVTRKLPIWNGASWSAPTATRSIAWALAYICKTRMADDRYDLAWLLAKDATWAGRGDYFDAIFDGQMTLGEALSSCARAGRAKWFQHGMTIRFLRDEPATLPVALFNVRNTVRGSFKTDYRMSGDETVDSVIIEYFDASKWATDQVLCQLPGYTADKPATLRLFGVTSRAQAYREGMYEAACHRYRRMLPSLTTEMEGFIPLPGDLVAIQRDKPGWGQGGDVLGYDAGTLTLTLSEPLVWTTGQHYFGFKKRDGSMSTPWAASQGADALHAVLVSALDFTPDTNLSRERTSYTFGPSSSFYQQVRLISPRPRSMERVELQFVNEDPAVHTADTGSVPAASALWNLKSVISRPAVVGINVVLGGTSGSPLTLVSWKPAASATDYVVETSEDNGKSWTRAGGSKTASYALPAKVATIRIRVAAIGLLQGDWAVWTGNVFSYPPANVTGFSVAATINGAVLSWNNVADVDCKDYEVRVGVSFAAGTSLGFFQGTSTPPIPLASGSYTWWIVARDILLNPSSAPASIALTVDAPAAPAVSASMTATDYLLSWSAPASTFPIENYEIYTGATWGTATLVATQKSTVFQNPATFNGERNYYIRAVDGAGNAGAVTQTSITITAPPAPAVTFQVIDNNVLLYWSQVAGTLPTVTYEIRKGASWAGGTLIGTKSGGFTTIFETVSGTYTYWIAAIDSAGNVGDAASASITVSQPPDYILKANYNTDFSGTQSNMVLNVDGSYLTPVNPTEVWSTHFTARSWTTPQDQINAGYPVFAQPNLSPGYYEETIDYGTLLASNRITVTLDAQDVVGTVARSCTISVSANGSAWTDYAGVWEIYATAFRYVKVRTTFTAAAATELLRVVGLNIRLDSKLKTITRMVNCVQPKASLAYAVASNICTVTEASHTRLVGDDVVVTTSTGTLPSGNYQVATIASGSWTFAVTTGNTSGNIATDTNGTIVFMTNDGSAAGAKSFLDVDAIAVTPQGTTPVIPVYDFTDVPDPLSLKILLFNTAGARVSGTASLMVRGF